MSDETTVDTTPHELIPGGFREWAVKRAEAAKAEAVEVDIHAGVHVEPVSISYKFGNGVESNLPVANIGETHRQVFSSGAYRNSSDGKIDPSRALSPLVLARYCEYMRDRRKQTDGTTRLDDNWKKGIALDSFMESGQRHNLHWVTVHDGFPCFDEDTKQPVDIEEACCALMFNVMGYLHEALKAKVV
jgi:hypothetical protein